MGTAKGARSGALTIGQLSLRTGVNIENICQKALERDPGSACNWDPFASRVRCG